MATGGARPLAGLLSEAAAPAEPSTPLVFPDPEPSSAASSAAEED